MNLKQSLAIVMAVLGAITASTAQLTDLFGQDIAKYIISCAGFINTILSVTVLTISGQGSLVKDVQAMPGVEKITVNEKANATLASIAVDPANPKVEPTPRAESKVTDTAKNG